MAGGVAGVLLGGCCCSVALQDVLRHDRGSRPARGTRFGARHEQAVAPFPVAGLATGVWHDSRAIRFG